MAGPGQTPPRNTEPVLTAGVITAATTSVLQVLFLWHVIPVPPDVDPATAQATLTAAVASIVGIVSAVWARGRVTTV